MSEAARGWIYRILVVVAVVAGIIGLVSEDQVAAIVNTIGLLLGAGLASAYTTVRGSRSTAARGDRLEGDGPH